MFVGPAVLRTVPVRMADDAAPEKPEILMRLALPRRVLLKEGDGGHMGSDMGGLKPFDERKDFAADVEYGERWPTTPGEVDTDSANHRRHEAFLDAQEWPGPENNWMSRRGHLSIPCQVNRGGFNGHTYTRSMPSSRSDQFLARLAHQMQVPRLGLPTMASW